MTSPHMLRPFSSRQLSLVAGNEGVVVFAVMGGRYLGPSVAVHAPTLVRRVADLAHQVETVVFVDEPVPDGATVSLIDDMLGAFAEMGVDALAQPVAAVEAVKRVEGRRVVEGIDRSGLLALRCPELVRRRTLQHAIAGIGDEMWVNPTALVAAAGGRIAVGGPSVPSMGRASR